MDNGKTLRPFGMRDKIGYAFGDFGCNTELCVHKQLSYAVLCYLYEDKPEAFCDFSFAR